MLKISDFANIFDVSVKTVRFYESKGLIKPAFVDIYSGYRYFDEKNIEEMSKIIALKELGLELSEIKNLDEFVLEKKIRYYENKVKCLNKNIHVLESLSIRKGELRNLKTFVNDEKAIGKWELEGIYEKRDDYPTKKSDLEIGIKELYLMPKGEEYWVISWTKGIIFINGRENNYEIKNDLMFINLVDPIDSSDYQVAVYKKVNNNKYTVDEIKRKDNINIEFIKDENLVGFWECVDFINSKDMFDENKITNNQYPLKQIIVTPSDKVIVDYQDKELTTKYSKGYIMNLALDNTLCAYEYKFFNDSTYLLIEWKSGDYVFGNMINGYYVLRKIK